MKVIFLDIDGVLNSKRYDNARDIIKEQFIDITRVQLVSQIVEQTGAVIVLSTTWRTYWQQGGSNNDTGRYIDETFASCGLSIFDKTPLLKVTGTERPREIALWIQQCQHSIEQYVILDDYNFGWDGMHNNWVKPNYMIGYGLEQHHVDKAICILNS